MKKRLAIIITVLLAVQMCMPVLAAGSPPEPTIYVATSLGAENKDYVHTLMASNYIGADVVAKERELGHIVKKPGTDEEFYVNCKNHPYMLLPGENVVIYADVPVGSTSEFTWTKLGDGAADGTDGKFGDPFTYIDVAVSSATTEADSNLPPIPNGYKREYCKVKALDTFPGPGTTTRGMIKCSIDGVDFYVYAGNKVLMEYCNADGTHGYNVMGSQMTHIDLEIINQDSIDAQIVKQYVNGSKITTKIKYNAYISDVNKVVATDNSNPSVPITFWNESETVSTPYIPNSAYKKNGEVGTSQFELTSFPNAKFNNVTEINEMEFDMNLEVLPVSAEITIERPGKTPIIKNVPLDGKPYAEDPDLPEEIKAALDKFVRENQVQKVGKQYVVDAMNYCPNHTGLDVKILTSQVVINSIENIAPVEVVLDGTSELRKVDSSTRTPANFKYELRDSDSEMVDSSLQEIQADVNGDFEFEKIKYTVPGTYTYTIREVLPTRDPSEIKNNQYTKDDLSQDANEVTVTVKVKEVYSNGTWKLTADVTYSKADGTAVEGAHFINIEREKKNPTPAPTPDKTPDAPNPDPSVKTGDNAPIAVMSIIMIASVLAMVAIKKRNKI